MPLRRLPAYAGGTAAAGAVTRRIATLHYAVLALAQRTAGDTNASDASRTRARQLVAQVPEEEPH